MSLISQIALRHLQASVKTLSVFDFDDTLATSRSSIWIEKLNGERLAMSSATYAHYSTTPGDLRDYSYFNDVVHPRKIKKNFDAFKASTQAPNTKTVILTARPTGAASAIEKFLESEGIKGVHVVALSSGDPYDKARWVDKEIEKVRPSSVKFFDDSSANVRAVAEYGEKHKKAGIHFESHNTPEPDESDYDGEPLEVHFKSDNPTVSKVTAPNKHPNGEHKTAPTGHWWEHQTKAFQEKYCGEHPQSQYCGNPTHLAGRTLQASNQALLNQIQQRSLKSHNPKVLKYLKSYAEKIRDAGSAAGIMHENLEREFKEFSQQPEDLTKGFTSKDFTDLQFALFGTEPKNTDKSASRVAKQWLDRASH